MWSPWTNATPTTRPGPRGAKQYQLRENFDKRLTKHIFDQQKIFHPYVLKPVWQCAVAIPDCPALNEYTIHKKQKEEKEEKNMLHYNNKKCKKLSY